MKVITEERLLAKREILNDRNNTQCAYLDGKKYLIDELIEVCQEIDTLTVSNLRPMSDAKPFEDVLTYKKFGDSNLGFIVYKSDDGRFIARENIDIWYNDYQLLGFIPLPIYKPELTVDGE